MGITSTEKALANMVSTLRKKQSTDTPKTFPKYKNDVAVEIFDNILKELKDLRQYLVQTTEENRTLRTRIEKFKNMLEID